MEIAGTSVRDGYLIELATLLRTAGSDTTAERLADAILDDNPRINLSVDDREAISRCCSTRPPANSPSSAGFCSKTGRGGTRTGSENDVCVEPARPPGRVPVTDGGRDQRVTERRSWSVDF